LLRHVRPALAIAFVPVVAMAVMMSAVALSLIAMAAGSLAFALLGLGLLLHAARRRMGLALLPLTFVMRAPPALAATMALMASVLPLGPLELGLRPAEAPDLFEVGLDGRSLRRLGRVLCGDAFIG